MKSIILSFFVLFLLSCSTVPGSPMDLLSSHSSDMSIENMEKRYPYFNVHPGFQIFDQDPGYWNPDNPPVITEEMKKESRILKVACKELMLNKLNIIRFVINTPEFATNLLKSQFYSSRDGKTIKFKDPFDSRRLLKVLQKVSFHTQIRKRTVGFGAVATANVGPFLYEESDNDVIQTPFQGYFVNYHNKEDWSKYYSLSSYYLGVLFHEMLHNLGFNHNLAGHNLPDATYGMQGVFTTTYDDPKWQQKYKKQLAAFQFYQKKYSHLIQHDDVAGPSSPRAASEDVGAHYHVHETYNEDGVIEICILKEDGSAELVKMKNGKVISRSFHRPTHS